MSATITALQQGRRRYQQQRRREAVRRVEDYRRWLKAGSDFRTMPAVPSDADYRLARSVLEERR